MTALWVGTYPAAGLGAPVGHGEGVWQLSFASGTVGNAIQVTTQAAPSFVLSHPVLPILYAVEESDPTAISVLSLEGEPREVARVVVGGSHGCHLLMAPDVSALYV